jgi:hypothetical protein
MILLSCSLKYEFMQIRDQEILLLPSNRSLKYEFMQIREKSDLFLATFVFVSTKLDTEIGIISMNVTGGFTQILRVIIHHTETYRYSYCHIKYLPKYDIQVGTFYSRQNERISAPLIYCIFSLMSYN